MITGNTHVKYGFSHFWNFSPFPVLASSVKLSHPHPNFLVQKIKKVSEPSGRIKLLTIKSSKSSTPVPAPSGWNPESTLNQRTHGSESKNMITMLI